jgi:hypothetical protein
MSFVVDVRKVAAVLLPDGKWRNVDDESFRVGIYEFRDDQSGSVHTPASPGARWNNPLEGETYLCPLTAILAIKYKR